MTVDALAIVQTVEGDAAKVTVALTALLVAATVKLVLPNVRLPKALNVIVWAAGVIVMVCVADVADAFALPVKLAVE